MQNKEFFIKHDGLSIHCKLDFPTDMKSEDDKRPLFILEHGLTGDMEEEHITAIASHVVSLGMAVLRVELYGHGKSDGRFEDHTILKWVDQMTGVIDYAIGLPFVSRLFLGGHSQGGLTTMLMGAIERDRLDAILPLSPAINIRDYTNKGEMMAMVFDPKHIPDSVVRPEVPGVSIERVFGGNYFRTAQLLPVEEAIAHYEKPVLIVHGDADEAVPVQYALDAANQYKNCTLKIIKGDTHNYDFHLDEVCNVIGEFLLAV